MLQYQAIFKKEIEGGYTVYFPSLPGCITYGKNFEEAEIMAQEALELYLETDEIESDDTGTIMRLFYINKNLQCHK